MDAIIQHYNISNLILKNATIYISIYMRSKEDGRIRWRDLKKVKEEDGANAID